MKNIIILERERERERDRERENEKQKQQFLIISIERRLRLQGTHEQVPHPKRKLFHQKFTIKLKLSQKLVYVCAFFMLNTLVILMKTA